MEKAFARISWLLHTLFLGLEPLYVLRQYLFGGAAFWFLTRGSAPSGQWYALLACFLLYPFAMFVYDSLVDFILGGWSLFQSIGLIIIWTFFKVLMIFCLSIFIAPIGIIFLLFTRNRGQ